MTLPPELSTIEGAQTLYDWFGYWPSFHDAEIISLHLNRSGQSSLVVHCWETASKEDDLGNFVASNAKHVVVKFLIDGILDLDLSDFSGQNVVSSIDVRKTEQGFLLNLSPCYGLAGTIEAKQLAIRLSPGAPQAAC